MPDADKSGYDVETYVSIYNADGFMTQIELSLDILAMWIPDHELQSTRSKTSLGKR